ncbi:hypothetical protein O0L34_g16609 [Tuta absoluta]|nr:hypothetical protein O0L34_g16609 [Tuta absoluta]
MKPVFVTLVIAILPLQLTVTEGFIECRTACRKCMESTEDIDLLEVYCSMCKECRDKRREEMARQTTPHVDPFPEYVRPVVRRRNPAPFRTRTFYRAPPALRMQPEDDERLASK